MRISGSKARIGGFETRIGGSEAKILGWPGWEFPRPGQECLGCYEARRGESKAATTIQQ